MKVIITPDAEADIAAEHHWYEKERKGLGKRFRQEIRHSVEQIRTNPLAYSQVYRDVRRVLLNRFPFSLYYVMQGQNIIVLACIHARRSPEFIRKRLALS